jgi:DNA-binding LacI/PurR family transcriptional regulator
MYDVARLAGVSHQTVSRVINGSEHVRPETRDRVMAAMEKLDYRPNSVARATAPPRRWSALSAPRMPRATS